MMRYGHVEARSREPASPVETLRERLKDLPAVSGRTHDGRLMEDAEYGVRRVAVAFAADNVTVKGRRPSRL
jgi:hypothetical protein